MPVTTATRPRATARTSISLRVPEDALATIDRAAAAQGADRTAFMIQAALDAAAAILERERVLRLGDAAFDELARALVDPPPPTAALVELLRTRPVWES